MIDNAMMQLFLDGVRGIVSEELAGIKADIAELKHRVTNLEQDVSELKYRVTNLEQDVSGLKQDFSSLKSIVTKLEFGQARLEREFAAMRSEMAEISEVVIITHRILTATNDMTQEHERKFEGIKDVLNSAV